MRVFTASPAAAATDQHKYQKRRPPVRRPPLLFNAGVCQPSLQTALFRDRLHAAHAVHHIGEAVAVQNQLAVIGAQAGVADEGHRGVLRNIRQFAGGQIFQRNAVPFTGEAFGQRLAFAVPGKMMDGGRCSGLRFWSVFVDTFRTVANS